MAALPASVLAAGMEYPDNGTIAIGRGGAHTANPEDGLAFQYNPAGLAQQGGLRLYIDSRATFQHLRFDSSTPNTPAVSNSKQPFVAPSLAVTYGLGKVGPLSELTFAVGATGPSAIGQSQFPKDGAQRYAIISTDYLIGYYSAAVAAGFAKGDQKLRIGLTGQLVQGSAEFSQAVWSGFGTYDSGPNKPTSTANDTIATFSGTSGFLPTFVLGLSVTPIRNLDIGLSYRPRIDFDAPGKLTLDLAPASKDIGAQMTTDKAALKLSLAAIARIGVAWQATPRLKLMADGVWEQWSAMKEIRIKTGNIAIKSGMTVDPVPLPDVVFPKNMQDAYSVRLGGEFDVSPKRLTVRAGYLFETTAIQKEYASVDFANWDRHGVSVGASAKAGPVWIDVAYAHHFVATQEVTNSKVMSQVSPKLGDLPASDSSVVGNGQYDSHVNIVSLSVRVPFGGE
jgi:long-subunit fatty acid transport protein